MRTKEQHAALLAQSEASRAPADAKNLQGRLNMCERRLARQKKKAEDLSFYFLVTLAALALLAGITLGLAVYFA